MAGEAFPVKNNQLKNDLYYRLTINFMNRTLQLLLISDVFVLTGFAFIDPILAIFVKDVIGGTVFAAGFAIALFLLTKSVVQLPLSRYLDRLDKKIVDKRRIRFLHLGGLCVALVPLIYISATDVQHVFLAQILHGIGSGFMYPTWVGLWTSNLDKHKEEFEWTVYSSSLGLCTAFAGFAGGFIAQNYGFRTTFVIVTFLVFVGFLLLLKLEKKRAAHVHNGIVHYHAREKNPWLRR